VRRLIQEHLNQLQPLEACMPILADNDVIVHRNPERLRDAHDLFRHLNIRVRRVRIA